MGKKISEKKSEFFLQIDGLPLTDILKTDFFDLL